MKTRNKTEKYIFKRFCKRCEKLFQPTGKYQEYCFDCRITRQNGKTKITKTN